MSECDTSINHLDSSLLDLKFSEQTLERITELGNLTASDISLDAVRGSEAEPLDLSLKDSNSSSFILNYLNGSNITDETNKFHDLRQSVNSILSTAGVSVNRNSNDIPYLGLNAPVAEILLQHGEFPASRKFDGRMFSKSTNVNLIRDNTSSAFKSVKTTINTSKPSELLTMASLSSLMSWGVGDGEAPSTNLCDNRDLENLSSQNVSGLHNIRNRPWNTDSMPHLLDNYRPAQSVTSFDESTDRMKSFDNYLSYENKKSTTIHSLGRNKVKHEIKPSPQHSLIHAVALDESTNAFRSHPLYPLLRDLATADYYFDHADFDVSPLLAFLPSSPMDMIKVYLERHPEAKNHNEQFDYQSEAIDCVIEDAIHFAHKCLLDRVRNLQLRAAGEVNAEIAAKEEMINNFYTKFMDVIQTSTPLNIPHKSNTSIKGNSPDSYFEQSKQFSPILLKKSPQSSLQTLSTDIHADRKRSHHSKESVKILTQWLKENRDNPYPNEQGKKHLADISGLTQQQVAHWFINARRRLLPKLRDSLINKEFS